MKQFEFVQTYVEDLFLDLPRRLNSGAAPQLQGDLDGIIDMHHFMKLSHCHSTVQ